MRSTAFGSKHFRPGGRSWHPASAESSVLFCRFCAVAAVAKGLPVFFVPKQPRVPLVGRDVVHLGRQGTASPAPALHAPRMIRQIRLAHPPPRSAIPTAGGAGPPVRRLRRVPLAVASGGYQGGAPRVPARVLGFGWHGLGLLSGVSTRPLGSAVPPLPPSPKSGKHRRFLGQPFLKFCDECHALVVAFLVLSALTHGVCSFHGIKIPPPVWQGRILGTVFGYRKSRLGAAWVAGETGSSTFAVEGRLRRMSLISFFIFSLVYILQHLTTPVKSCCVLLCPDFLHRFCVIKKRSAFRVAK